MERKNKNSFKAEIIADSINTSGERITTMVVTFPRIILAEMNTHRVLSKNSASSRAIPFNKMLQLVIDEPFIPLKWMKDHSGMQGVEYYDDDQLFNIHDALPIISKKLKDKDGNTPDYLTSILHRIENTFSKYGVNTLSEWWLIIRNRVIECAVLLYGFGVTKQLCNRLLEPFMYHTAIITGTEWENFFSLRVHEAAEIHIQHIAGLMLEAYNNSTPKKLNNGEWHIPFGDKIDELRLLDEIVNPTGELDDNMDEQDIQIVKSSIKIAVARCARVSYLNFEGKDDYEADIKLHDRLFEQGHFSPFEHCAYSSPGVQSGNFKGWTQYRKTLPNECRTDNRVIKKYPNAD